MEREKSIALKSDDKTDVWQQQEKQQRKKMVYNCKNGTKNKHC